MWWVSLGRLTPAGRFSWMGRISMLAVLSEIQKPNNNREASRTSSWHMPDRGCSRWKLLPKLSVSGLWHAQKLRTVGGAGSTFPGLGSAWGPRASQGDSFKVLSCQMSAAVLHQCLVRHPFGSVENFQFAGCGMCVLSSVVHVR